MIMLKYIYSIAYQLISLSLFAFRRMEMKEAKKTDENDNSFVENKGLRNFSKYGIMRVNQARIFR